MCRTIIASSLIAASAQVGADMNGAQNVKVFVPNNALAKTRLCKFYLHGKCKRGAACSFAHGEKALQPQPDLQRTQLCYQFMEIGRCRFGDRCTFAHGTQQLRSPAPKAFEAQPQRGRMAATAAVACAMNLPDALPPFGITAMKPQESAADSSARSGGRGQRQVSPLSGTSAPSTTPSLSGSADEGSWSDSDLANGAWMDSSMTTPLDFEEEEEEDGQQLVEIEIVVDRTFISMKLAASSAAARRRCASEPPCARRC
mmetsp:Transcript_124411/g.243984  ORF Transcript_124411/g.243984 Transcript_124411/m.243984 type:complete len:257 (-) Transcript_124411:469-1239(-)